MILSLRRGTIPEIYRKGKRLKRIFFFGLGYSALYLARQLISEGWVVRGTVRGTEKMHLLRKEGIQAHLFGETFSFAKEDRIVSSIPPDAEGDPVLRLYGPSLREACPAWMGYLSTTGVYGDHQGRWVQEDSECRPSGPRQFYRLRAEKEWREAGANIFRLAGIYGPGRSVLDSILKGTAQPIDKPGHVFGRIHVADIASALKASLCLSEKAATYNLTDDEPAEPRHVIDYACALLNLPPLPAVSLEGADLSPMARSFWRDHKRVRNDKIKRDLAYRFIYPTFREGLRAILAQHTFD